MEKHILFVDTETCNTLVDPILYNIGGYVVNLKGQALASFNFLIREVWEGMRKLMQTCYYANKIPTYEAQIASGEIEVVSLYEAVQRIRALVEKYNCTAWCAHNARFDNKSMNNLERYLTKSKYRYFLPYGLEAWDTMKMAHDVILPKASYRKFCEENGYMTKHKTPRPKLTAEVLYRFISKDEDFTEVHKALEDVEIEVAILAYCVKQHKKMRKNLWEKA